MLRWLTAGESHGPALVAVLDGGPDEVGEDVGGEQQAEVRREVEAAVRAPPLEGVYGGPVPLSDGTTVSADDNYLLDSILEPDKQIVRGYAPIMPTFRGQLSQDDLDALLAYLRSDEVP